MVGRTVHGNLITSFSMPMWKQLMLCLGCTLVAFFLTAALRVLVPGATLVFFMGAVAVSAYIAGVRGALLAALISFCLSDYFFGTPYGLLFDDWRNIIWLSVFLGVAWLIGWLQEQWRLVFGVENTTRQQLETILSTAADGVLLLDANLQTRYANSQAQRLLGLKQPLDEGNLLLDRISAELDFCDENEVSLTSDQLPFRSVLKNRLPASAIVGCGDKGAAYERWLRIQATPLFDANGNVESIVAVFTDLSAQRRNQRRAEEERQRLRSIFEVLSDAVIVTDHEGVLVMQNPAAQELLGRAEVQTRGYMLSELFTVEPEAALDLMIADASSAPSRGVLPAKSVLTRPDTPERIPVSGSVFTQEGHFGKIIILRDLREEEAMNRLREQSERRLRAVIDNLGFEVAVLTPDGTVLEFNQQAQTANQVAAEEVIGKPWQTISIVERNPDFAAYLAPRLEAVLRGERIRADVALTMADGTTRHLDLMAAPMFGDHGEIVNLVLSGVDITARKAAETQIHTLLQVIDAERRRLNDLLESLPGIVWESAGSPDGPQRLTYVSAYVEKMFGYSVHEMLTHTASWQELIHPEDIEMANREVRRRYEEPGLTDEDQPIEFRVRTKDGAVLTVDLRLRVVRDQNGTIVGSRGIFMDVTSQKDAERRILQLMHLVEIGRKRLQDTIDSVPAIIWEAVGPPENQKMVFVSNYAEAISGYTAEEWMADSSVSMGMIVPEDVATVSRIVALNYYEGADLPVPYRIRTKDGRIRHVEARVSIVRGDTDDPIGVRGVTLDVTELRETEEELRRSNEELQQFAYIASHDLQEPLRMVTSYLQLIEQRYDAVLDPEGHEFIGFAVDGAARMKRLITDLLAYSRVQTNRDPFRPVDLNTIVSAVARDLGARIEECDATIRTDMLPTVSGNATMLTQLFQNLVSNALKFRSERPPEIRISVERQGAYWQFTIADNGIGFDEKYSDRIFVIFQRLHSQSRYSGTGIGLAICKKVVERHYGTIWARSTPGAGSTFCFTLPVNRTEDDDEA